MRYDYVRINNKPGNTRRDYSDVGDYVMERLFRWYPGRQPRCPYRKFCFLKFKLGRFGFDGYIIRFDSFGTLMLHKDVLADGKHYRLNINLWGKCEFKIMGTPHISIGNRILLFRPDVIPHGLLIFDKPTYIFSMGFAKYDKKTR